MVVFLLVNSLLELYNTHPFHSNEHRTYVPNIVDSTSKFAVYNVQVCFIIFKMATALAHWNIKAVKETGEREKLMWLKMKQAVARLRACTYAHIYAIRRSGGNYYSEVSRLTKPPITTIITYELEQQQIHERMLSSDGKRQKNLKHLR